LLPLCGMLAFTWDENNYMCFRQRHSIPLVDNLTLCSQNLHISWCCYNWPNVCKFISQSCVIQGFATSNVVQAKKKSYHDQHPIDQFLCVAIEVFGCLHKHAYVFLHDCANAIWSLKGLERPSLFCLGYLSSLKNFNYITMDANILHFKSNNDSRPSYFPNSTHSKHTLHHHDRPIIGSWLLRWRVFWLLVCVNLTSFKLSLVFNIFVHFSNMQCVS
jgi:hypothetical protein